MVWAVAGEKLCGRRGVRSLSESKGGKDLVAAFARRRGFKEFDGIDVLCERYFLIHRMLSGNSPSISAHPRQCHMRAKRSLIRLPIGLKECGAQSRNFIARRAFRPQQTRSSWLRPIAETLECQRESAKSAGHAAKFLDGLGSGSIVPGGHECEVNVGRGHKPNSGSFQTPRKPREFIRDFRRNPQAHENAYALNLCHDHSVASWFGVVRERATSGSLGHCMVTAHVCPPI